MHVFNIIILFNRTESWAREFNQLNNRNVFGNSLNDHPEESLQNFNIPGHNYKQKTTTKQQNKKTPQKPHTHKENQRKNPTKQNKTTTTNKQNKLTTKTKTTTMTNY